MNKSALNSIAYKTLLFVLFCTATFNIAAFGELDREKYIAFDEIRPDMDGYCLTVVRGTKIEKFPIKVISPIKNFQPGRNAILVTGTDEVFQKIGAVQGCSGSPVYIDGRMAGALAAGFRSAKDPIYLITPIEEMLKITEGYIDSDQASDSQTLGIDFNAPIDLSRSYDQVLNCIKNLAQDASSQNRPMALVTSLPQNACDTLNNIFGKNYINALSATAGSQPPQNDNNKPVFEPGGVISIPLISGDISVSGIGTVTEVVGDTVYGFGHNFLGYGNVNFPLAAGQIHTVIASRDMSFKLGQAGPIAGTLIYDQATGIVGKIGQMPRLIPITITVKRFNDSKTKTYNCQIAYNRMYTPMLIQTAISGAGTLAGPLPPDHSVKYKTTVNIEGFDPIVFSDLSSGTKLNEIIPEAAGTVSLLMTNPYENINIDSIDVQIDITAENTRAVIDTVKISNTTFKAGETAKIDVILQGNRIPKFAYSETIKIPEDTLPGDYSIYVAGGYEYERLLRKLAPQKTTARSLETLVDAIKILSRIRHDRLYFILQLKPSGVTIMQKELPYLPDTKTILLNSKKRTIRVQPLNHWVEKTIDIEKVLLGIKEIKIKVRK